ncbi:MAG: hypothetical protein ACRDO1_07365 [Nocardioidaceae bacterium]
MTESHVPPAAASAVADLAQRIGVDPAEITVVSVEEVTWRDGSLGCPREGMMYTQALVPGTRIMLARQAQTYEYHAGAGREPFLCDNPQPPL